MSNVDRRDFLKLSAATGAGLAVCPSLPNAMELELGGQDWHQIRTFHERERSNYLCTMCPYFDGGFTYSEGGKIKKAEGNQNHIATRGKFCTKGLASFFGAYDPDRILTPLKRVGERGSGQWKSIGWDEAIAEVAGKITEAIDADPQNVCLNEGGFKEGATARFMNTIGSGSIVRSRLPSISNATKKAALNGMMGVDFTLPDLEKAQYVLSFGANIIETALPLAHRLTDGIVNKKLKLITFDVRLSNTAGKGDEWVPVFPGSDGIIALAMANVIMSEGLADTSFIDDWTNYTSDSLADHLKQFTLDKASKASGVPAKTIRRIAIEFAKAKPGAVFSFNGVTSHRNGVHAEMACQLLAVVTGNVDTEGGVCLPRQFNIAEPQPAPMQVENGGDKLHHTFPFEVKGGERHVSVLLNHMSNPAFSAPASSVWKEVLADESLVPYLVDFSPFMSETSALADIILPDVVAVERHDLASSPTSTMPWAGMGMPSGKPQGKAKDVRETLKKIVEAIDADGSRDMKQYWAFSNAKDWVKKEVEATPELADAYKKLKRKGLYPNYGKIDKNTREIIGKNGPVKPAYKTYEANSFPTESGRIELFVGSLEEQGHSPLPTWEANPKHKGLADGQFVMSTFKMAYHTLSMTTNLKPLAELMHSNPLWINKEVARKLKIKDGGLVRVETEAGYMVTKAWLTNGIHPQSVGIHAHVGRTEYGRIAKAQQRADAPSYSQQEDLDAHNNVWWRDAGVNPNDIIPLSIDPTSGAHAWNDTVVTVSPANPGDKYGEIKVDNAKHLAIYKALLGNS